MHNCDLCLRFKIINSAQLFIFHINFISDRGNLKFKDITSIAATSIPSVKITTGNKQLADSKWQIDKKFKEFISRM